LYSSTDKKFVAIHMDETHTTFDCVLTRLFPKRRLNKGKR
jgi:hypothetical protein